MIESERDLWRSLVQSLFSCRATWSWLSKTMSIPLFNISMMKIPENLCQCSITLTTKRCFLMSRGNLLSVPITSGAVTGHHWEEYTTCSVWHSVQVFIYINGILLSFFFSRLNSNSSLSLSPSEGCFSPLYHVCGPLQDHWLAEWLHCEPPQ